MTPSVVKAGGSLMKTGRLARVLDLVAEAKAPIVVVPGGGPFADAVRAAQSSCGFSDRAAHSMALLAMEQMARVIADMRPAFALADDDIALRDVGRSGRVAVWLASRMASQDASIPQDWSSTSDGLAAWLALRLGSPSLIIVKSRPADPSASAYDLAREGVIDGFFASIASRSRFAWRIVDAVDESGLRGLLSASPRQASPHV